MTKKVVFVKSVLVKLRGGKTKLQTIKTSFRLGLVFKTTANGLGVITVERRISPVSRVLAVEYVVRVSKGNRKFVIGIKDNKFDAIQLAKKTKERLKLAKRAKEVAVKAGQVGFRVGKKGAQLAFKGLMAFEKFTRPTGRKKTKKKRGKK